MRVGVYLSHTHTHTLTHSHTHTHIHTHTYTYTHTLTHTPTHTLTHARNLHQLYKHLGANVYMVISNSVIHVLLCDIVE